MYEFFKALMYGDNTCSKECDTLIFLLKQRYMTGYIGGLPTGDEEELRLCNLVGHQIGHLYCDISGVIILSALVL